MTYDQAYRFPLCHPEVLQKAFERACLEQVSAQPLSVTTRFANFDDYWQPFLSGQGSAPNYLESRDELTRNLIRERLRAVLPTDAAGVIELPARAWAVRGKPT